MRGKVIHYNPNEAKGLISIIFFATLLFSSMAFAGSPKSQPTKASTDFCVTGPQCVVNKCKGSTSSECIELNTLCKYGDVQACKKLGIPPPPPPSQK